MPVYTFILEEKQYTVVADSSIGAMAQINLTLRGQLPTPGVWAETSDPFRFKWIEGNFYD